MTLTRAAARVHGRHPRRHDESARRVHRRRRHRHRREPRAQGVDLREHPGPRHVHRLRHPARRAGRAAAGDSSGRRHEQTTPRSARPRSASARRKRRKRTPARRTSDSRKRSARRTSRPSSPNKRCSTSRPKRDRQRRRPGAARRARSRPTRHQPTRPRVSGRSSEPSRDPEGSARRRPDGSREASPGPPSERSSSGSPPRSPPSDVTLFTKAVTYAIIGLSLNVLIGYTGQISLGHQAFVGIGAFTSAYMMSQSEQPFLDRRRHRDARRRRAGRRPRSGLAARARTVLRARHAVLRTVRREDALQDRVAHRRRRRTERAAALGLRNRAPLLLPVSGVPRRRAVDRLRD